MNWSLGETAALALKAARGAGMSWGLAEETAASVVWLHSRGLPGISALCSYLGQAAAPQSPEGGCPIMTGCALIDGMMDVPETSSQTLDLGHVHAPLLLLPFVARLEPGHYWLQAPGLQGTVDIANGDAWQSHCLCGSGSCTVSLGDRPQVDPALEMITRVNGRFTCCVDRLDAYAHRTYAPATGQSRMSGAGAGLTDND
ncbi:MAG: DUF3726 domain-containing protein [Pseudomonadota bacterium]|nr:DUF3726 domain-containing protein [Pseudomonadota bacterium]